MKIDDLIKKLQSERKKHGNLEVAMVATTLEHGFSRNEDGMTDVFQSTVETVQMVKKDDMSSIGDRIMLMWQM